MCYYYFAAQCYGCVIDLSFWFHFSSVQSKGGGPPLQAKYTSLLTSFISCNLFIVELVFQSFISDCFMIHEWYLIALVISWFITLLSWRNTSVQVEHLFCWNDELQLVSLICMQVVFIMILSIEMNKLWWNTLCVS